MTIELDSNTYILGFWFCSDLQTGNDWLCNVIRDPADGGWKGKYRFRYRQDEKLWDSEDRKVWYDFKPVANDTEEKIIQVLDDFQKQVSIIFMETDKIIVQGDMKKLFKLAKGHDWMNIKQVEIPRHPRPKEK